MGPQEAEGKREGGGKVKLVWEPTWWTMSPFRLLWAGSRRMAAAVCKYPMCAWVGAAANRGA